MARRRWERIVDQLVSEAIGDGDVSNLAGAGAPLQLNNESHTPAEWRTAFKIMNDNDVLPDWIAAANALDKQERELRQSITERARLYRNQSGGVGAQSAGANTAAAWGRHFTSIRRRIRRHNDELLLLNLKLPAGLPHRAPLNAEHLIQQALESDKNTVDSGGPD